MAADEIRGEIEGERGAGATPPAAAGTPMVEFGATVVEETAPNPDTPPEAAPGEAPANPSGEQSGAPAGVRGDRGDAVAGVRGADGVLAWVRGVPWSIAAGTVVRYTRAGIEASGRVSIVPALIAWCDPEVVCCTFLEATALEVPEAMPVADPPPATLLAPEGAPDAATLVSRLALARAELHRLDDPGIALIRMGPPRSKA